MVLGIFANTASVLAEEYTAQNSLTSLIQVGPGGTSTYVSPEKVVRDTYWADLEGNPITIKFVVKRPKLKTLHIMQYFLNIYLNLQNQHIRTLISYTMGKKHLVLFQAPV